MKKYLKLTSREAIKHFLHHDDSLVPETSAEISKKLDDLDKLETSLSVTITMPTQRTAPDTKYDALLLKNLITKAEEKLREILDKRQYPIYQENLKEGQETVDHGHNLDSLVLYANEHFVSVVKLPIHLKEEVIIGSNFDIRPLIKTEQQNEYYYILSVSRQKIRLIEVLSNRTVVEIDNEDFPYENTEYYTTDPIKLRQDVFIDNLIKEFFNDADKLLRNYILTNPYPLVLMGDTKSVSYFVEQMDDKSLIVNHIEGNYDNAPLHEIINVAKPAIEKFKQDNQKQYQNMIDTAISQNLLVTDIDEIYNQSKDGNADTLFMGMNYSLRGVIDDEGHIEIDNSEENGLTFNDVTIELIKNVYNNGGKVIFLNDDLLKDYEGIVMVKRY